MTIKNRMTLVGLTLMICLVGLLSIPTPAITEEIISLKAATTYPLKHRIVTDCFDVYSQEIEKRTNGKVKITWFHAGSIANYEKMYDAVQSGMVDMGWMAVDVHPHYWTISKGISLPFLAENALHAAVIGDEMWKQIPEFHKEFENFKYLGLCSTDIINLAWVEKIAPRTLDELKGMRVGTWAGNLVSMFQKWPCSMTYVKSEDLYLALQRKMVNGITCPNAPLRSYKFTDVTQGHTIGNFAVSPFVWVMNKSTWEKLPPDVQKVFDDLNPSMTRLAGTTLTNEGVWVMDALKERGDVFAYLNDEEKAQWKAPLKPIFDEFAQSLNEKGLDGQAILNKLLKISDETRKTYSEGVDEWWQQSRMGKLK